MDDSESREDEVSFRIVNVIIYQKNPNEVKGNQCGSIRD